MADYEAMYNNLKNYECENQLSFDDCFTDYQPEECMKEEELELEP